MIDPLIEEIKRLLTVQGGTHTVYPEVSFNFRYLLDKLDAAEAQIKASEIPCSSCGGEVHEFSISNQDWNTIIRREGPETDKEYLCINCFGIQAANYINELRIKNTRLKDALDACDLPNEGGYQQCGVCGHEHKCILPKEELSQ